jgi:hypothetical protein
LVETAVAVLARIRGMDQQTYLARSRCGLDAVEAVDEIAGARFHAETVERSLAKRGFGALAEIRGNLNVTSLERALECALELRLGVRSVELRARDSNPGTAAWRARADVGRDTAIGSKRESDQLLSRGSPPREDAGALRDVRF